MHKEEIRICELNLLEQLIVRVGNFSFCEPVERYKRKRLIHNGPVGHAGNMGARVLIK